jgi:hypothetical protein
MDAHPLPHAMDVRLVLNMVKEGIAEAIDGFVTVKPDASPHSLRVWHPPGLTRARWEVMR